MASADNIRDRIIDKLLTMLNEELLAAFDQLLATKTDQDAKVQLTDAQKRMLAMSEEDIAQGRLISQEDFEWLKELYYEHQHSKTKG